MHRERHHLGMILLLTLVVAAAAGLRAQTARPHAAVAGVVRDAQGVAQMGALVQVLAPDQSVVGSALTDLHGRYLIGNLMQGKYEVRATAAFFVPALKQNVLFRTGGQAVVNLTLIMLFDTAQWIPAERRRADEPADDWKWTLRSAANRSILRVVDEGQVVLASSSAAEGRSRNTTQVRATVEGGDGGFGEGGLHHVLAGDWSETNGSGVTFRTDLAQVNPRLGLGLQHLQGTSAGSATAFTVSSGIERRTPLGGVSRTVANFSSHPEIVGGTSNGGLQYGAIANAQRMQIGDLLEAEYGSLAEAVHAGGYSLSAQPFVSLRLNPQGNWNVIYRMATSAQLQSFDGLNSIQLEVPIVVTSGASGSNIQRERGRHQEAGIIRKTGRGSVQVSLYKDALRKTAVGGEGLIADSELDQPGVSADTATNRFNVLADGYTAEGVHVSIIEPIGQTMWAAVEYTTGQALSSQPAGDFAEPLPARAVVSSSLASAVAGLHPVSSQSVAVALKGSFVRTGTKLRASYRWQPSSLVTPVGRFEAFSDQAYLSVYIRQPLRFGRWLPQGLEAVVDGTNLLSQGYESVQGADGGLLYLSQAPRSLQAGLALAF